MVVTPFMIWGGVTYYAQSKQLTDKESKLHELQAQKAAVQAEKTQLEQKVKQLNDNEYISELARQNLFLSKKGEVIFITPDGTKK
ncbi:FtsB family cell division protein [Aneurinibacillus terranovensis]|uniref:FtsB family cell division protein n=1 Tax=Aneurinibacillus terranovensis TaxID=278991 RepID=UPI003CCB9B15